MDEGNGSAAPGPSPRRATHREHGHRAVARRQGQNGGIRANGATDRQRMPGHLERSDEMSERPRAGTNEPTRAAQGDRTRTENRRNLKHDHDPK